MSFSLGGYRAELKSKIEDYGNKLAEKKQINTSTEYNSNTGLKLTEQQRKDLSVSLFNVKGGNAPTDASNAGSSKTQKQGADVITTFAVFIQKTATSAVNALEQVIRTLEAKLNGLNAESSAIASNQTSGQSVKPEENIPTNNQGNNKNEVKGENNNAKNTDNNTEIKDDSDKKPQEENTQNSKNSKELDKAAKKEANKQYEEAKIKLNQEAEKISNTITSSAA